MCLQNEVLFLSYINSNENWVLSKHYSEEEREWEKGDKEEDAICKKEKE